MVNTRSNKSLSSLARASRILYLVLAVLFTLGVGVQVFLAGMGVLVSPSYFVWHETFAHFIEFIPILMVVVAAVARLSIRIILLTVLLSVLFILQYVFLYLMPELGLTPLRALHAVNALALFWLGMYLGQSVWRLHKNSTNLSASNGVNAKRTGAFTIRNFLIIFIFVLIAVVLNVWGLLFGDDERTSNTSPASEGAESSETVRTSGQVSLVGETIYSNNCAVCHGNEGQGGVGEELAGNRDLADTSHVVGQLLKGQAPMPAFNSLSDEEIASVASYIRNSWGNEFGEVSARDVAVER